jgi:hypothetical protein
MTRTHIRQKLDITTRKFRNDIDLIERHVMELVHILVGGLSAHIILFNLERDYRNGFVHYRRKWNSGSSFDFGLFMCLLSVFSP